MKLYDIAELRTIWTPAQLKEAQEATKKKRNTYRLLALILLLCGGIGLFLPFGKLAQLYGMGYDQLKGKPARVTGAGWAFAGFIASLVMGFLGKAFPSMICARFIGPSDDDT